MNPPAPVGAAERRGPLRAGDRVQLTDPKGRHHTIVLVTGKTFHTHRGQFQHDESLAGPRAPSCETPRVSTSGVEAVAERLRDVHAAWRRRDLPQGLAQIIQYRGRLSWRARMEAGVGSGGAHHVAVARGGGRRRAHLDRASRGLRRHRASQRRVLLRGPTPRVEAVDRRLRRARAMERAPAPSIAWCWTCSRHGRTSMRRHMRSPPEACSSPTWRRRLSCRGSRRNSRRPAASPSLRPGRSMAGRGTLRASRCGPTTAWWATQGSC